MLTASGPTADAFASLATALVQTVAGVLAEVQPLWAMAGAAPLGTEPTQAAAWGTHITMFWALQGVRDVLLLERGDRKRFRLEELRQRIAAVVELDNAGVELMNKLQEATADLNSYESSSDFVGGSFLHKMKKNRISGIEAQLAEISPDI